MFLLKDFPRMVKGYVYVKMFNRKTCLSVVIKYNKNHSRLQSWKPLQVIVVHLQPVFRHSVVGANSWKEGQCKADPYEEMHHICASSGNGGKPAKKPRLLILNNFSRILLR